MIHILLATGFEEIEAITIIDILRRLGLEVQTCSVTGTRMIHGAHGIPVMVDSLFRRSTVNDTDCIVLPGGMPGTQNLWASETLKKCLVARSANNMTIAAICAAPMILGRLGILKGRRATCYPGFEEYLEGANVIEEDVVIDENIITGRGPAAAKDFAFAIASKFLPPHEITHVKKEMLYTR